MVGMKQIDVMRSEPILVKWSKERKHFLEPFL